MDKISFRNLTAQEIECRIGTVTTKGCSLLLYKDARCDMALLDEVFGPFGWKREHELINGNLFCTVSVRSDDGEWVSKQDVGVESYTEKEKGQASDAFKRACVNWGIGRELYTAPFVWITLDKSEWKTDSRGKQVPNVKFEVLKIGYEGKTITSLEIIESKTKKVRYKYGTTETKEEREEMERAIEEAVQSIKQCKSREELVRLWNELTGLHSNQKFIDALNEKQQELNQNAA